MTTSRHALVAALFVAAALVASNPALAIPDLRHGRPVGAVTVFPDDQRRNLFYYAPGELAVATRDDGAPDVHLLHARYTGSVVARDQGTALLRSIFSVRVLLSGPTTAQLSETRRELSASIGNVELRPLPIRRLESAIVYAAAAPAPTDAAATAPPSSEPRALPAGHFETTETAAASGRDGYWTERVYTLRLEPPDAQLLSSALEHGQVALSVGYAFLADGIGPDEPIQTLSGSPALVEQLQTLIAPRATDGTGPDGGSAKALLYLVRAGAVGITVDVARWPQLVRRVDINDAVPPGYAALDIYCYDFSQAMESPLYEKQIEIEASAVGGRPVALTTTFTRAQPDIYARSVRFPVAVRLDRPYRYRIVDIAQDGTTTTTTWREQTSWTALLDVTSQGGRR